jgi:hypothetical protein
MERVISREQITAMVFELVKEEVKRVGLEAANSYDPQKAASELVEAVLDTQGMNRYGFLYSDTTLTMEELDEMYSKDNS